MSGARSGLDTERALAIVLAVAVVGVALAFAGELLSMAIDAAGSPGPVIGTLVLALVVLWLFDRI